MLDANDLLEKLIELQDEHGSLVGVPLSVFVNGDRQPIQNVDVFTNGIKNKLHSIDLDISYE